MTTMPAVTDCRKPAIDGDDRAEGGADQRDQVGERDEQRDQTGERHPETPARVREQPADDADQQVAGEVPGDGLGAVVADPADPFRAPLVEQGEEAVDDLGASSTIR